MAKKPDMNTDPTAIIDETDDPLELLTAIIARNPHGTKAEHLAEFKKLLRLDSYREVREAIMREMRPVMIEKARRRGVKKTKRRARR